MNKTEISLGSRVRLLLTALNGDPCGVSLKALSIRVELLRSLLTDPLDSSALIFNRCQERIYYTISSGMHFQNKSIVVKSFGTYFGL